VADPVPPPTLVLASGSPRRLELLATLGLHPVVRPPNVDEARHPDEGPGRYVTRLAALKAGASVEPGEVALGADTVVVLGHRVLGKPGGPADAAATLALLSDGTHQVLTAQAVISRAGDGDLSEPRGALSATKVTFRPLSRAEIDSYVATGEPMDKAGAYAIQGGGGAFVDHIEGRRDTVIGLDLASTRRLLRMAGVTVPCHPESPEGLAATPAE
jgi:septum formation protein